MKQNLDEKIEKLLDALEIGMLSLKTSKFWPANPPQMDSYWNDYFAEVLMRKIDKPPKLWPNIEVLKNQLLNHLLIGLKVLKIRRIIKNEDVYKFLQKYFGIMERKTNDDIFCLNGTNRILDNKEVNRIIKKIDLIKVDDELRKKTGYLHSLLSSFVWSTVFDAYAQQGMIIHGPYPVKIENKDLFLIIREFYDFKEKIWSMEEIPKIKTFSFYENIEVRFDFLNHMTSSSSLPSALVFFASHPSLDEIRRLEEKIEKLLVEQRKRVEALRYEEIILKALEINVSSFPKLIGEEEKEKLLKKASDSIKRNKEKYWKRFEEVKQERNTIRRVFDPRNLSF
jgi:hypothetical protein